jgi:hypothetical protein
MAHPKMPVSQHLEPVKILHGKRNMGAMIKLQIFKEGIVLGYTAEFNIFTRILIRRFLINATVLVLKIEEGALSQEMEAVSS